jgi:hypothetical protein
MEGLLTRCAGVRAGAEEAGSSGPRPASPVHRRTPRHPRLPGLLSSPPTLSTLSFCFSLNKGVHFKDGKGMAQLKEGVTQ